MNAVGRILDRLELVRPTGKGRWIARCPGHADRTPSLSIRETDDGRVLLHDFGGCETGDVLAAIGLDLRDLFDQPLGHQLSQSRSRIPARDLLDLVSFEIDVAVILLAEALERKSPLTELGWERLAKASARISAAKAHARGL